MNVQNIQCHEFRYAMICHANSTMRRSSTRGNPWIERKVCEFTGQYRKTKHTSCYQMFPDHQHALKALELAADKIMGNSMQFCHIVGDFIWNCVDSLTFPWILSLQSAIPTNQIQSRSCRFISILPAVAGIHRLRQSKLLQRSPLVFVPMGHSVWLWEFWDAAKIFKNRPVLL